MYFTLNSNNIGKYDEIATYIFEQKKSKFISYVFKITNENEAKKYIADEGLSNEVYVVKVSNKGAKLTGVTI